MIKNVANTYQTFDGGDRKKTWVFSAFIDCLVACISEINNFGPMSISALKLYIKVIEWFDKTNLFTGTPSNGFEITFVVTNVTEHNISTIIYYNLKNRVVYIISGYLLSIINL